MKSTGIMSNVVFFRNALPFPVVAVQSVYYTQSFYTSLQLIAAGGLILTHEVCPQFVQPLQLLFLLILPISLDLYNCFGTDFYNCFFIRSCLCFLGELV